MNIHEVPISSYKQAYYLLQSFYADFHFNKEQPLEKAKLINLIYLLAKKIEEDYSNKILAENNITDKDMEEYFTQLTEQSLI